LICAIGAIVSFSALTLFKARLIQAAAAWVLCLTCLMIVGQMRKERSSTDPAAQLLFSSAFLCFTAGVVFAFGPLGNPEKGQYPLGVFSLFYYGFPGFDALRAVARFGLLALMGLCFVTSGALDAVSRRHQHAGRLVALLLIIAVLFETQHSAFPLESPPPAPQVLQADLPPGSRTIFLPLSTGTQRGSVESWGEYARLATTYMVWGTDRGLQIINGYSGQRSKLMLELPAATESFPSQKSLGRLSTISGLEFIVVVASEMKDPSWRDRVEAYRSQLRIISEDSAGNVLIRFTPRLSLQTGSPVGLLLPANGAGRVEVTFDGPPECPTSWALADSPTAAALNLALIQAQYAYGSTIAVSLPPDRFNVRPRILALGSSCSKTLIGSRIELPAEAW
jgi:hypothetical protein